MLLEVYRRRTFLAAGRELGLSTSTVARRIGALEAELGRPLVHRSTEGASLEPAALPLIALAQQLEQGLEASQRDAPEAGVVQNGLAYGVIINGYQPQQANSLDSAMQELVQSLSSDDLSAEAIRGCVVVLIDVPFKLGNRHVAGPTHTRIRDPPPSAGDRRPLREWSQPSP